MTAPQPGGAPCRQGLQRGRERDSGLRLAGAGYQQYGRVVAGGGLAIVYISAYAAHSLYDLVSAKSIRSGKIAAYLELRDNTLVQAQAQIDQFAASMASALSDKMTNGVAAPASVLPAAGYDLDLTGLQSGNVIHVTYKDNVTGATHNLSIVRVDDPGVLPLGNSATLDPNDEVLGVDFSGGMASVVSQLNTALGASASLQFSNPAGSTLRVLDDGALNLSDVTAASVTTTMSSLTSGNPQLPLFTDNGVPFTGAITANGSQQTGFAGRISINNALLSDPSRPSSGKGRT